MSKRAEEAALKAYPKEEGKVWSSAFGTFEFDKNAAERKGYQEGYEQAEKDTTDRAAKWIREHWREYIWGPDADGCIGFGLWENDFRKAIMEEE